MCDKIAILPGTFDPIHNGHLEIVKRALGTFDKIVLALGINPAKEVLFTPEERLDMIRNSIKDLEPRVEYDSFKGLLVDYAERRGANAIIGDSGRSRISSTSFSLR